MTQQTQNLLRGINLVHFEGIKTISVDIEDLLELRKVILEQEKLIQRLEKENKILSARLSFEVFKTPKRNLKQYLDVRV